MPLHLQSITKEADNSELFAWLVQNGMDMADTIFISSDGRFILIQTNIIDTISDSVIGKLVYTLEKSDELKQLNILDLDIVINSSNYCEVEFIRKLEGSSDANEYYEVETVAEGQHLEIETVNRHTVSDDLEEKTMQLRFSAFPFQLSVFHDIESLQGEKMKLFEDFEAVKFPEENLIFVTHSGYLYYIYNELLYAKDLTEEQIDEYNANRPMEDNTEIELIIDFYNRFIYRMEYMIRVGKEKGYDLISFMGP